MIQQPGEAGFPAAPGSHNDKTPQMAAKTDGTAELLARLSDWWYEARDLHANNRREQARDAAFYDSEQWTAEEIQALAERHQAPLVYNKAKLALDWLIGTERRTRIDWRISPRTPDDVDASKSKQAFVKYLDDVNGFSFERSRAFEDCIKVGVGWTDETVTLDTDKPPVLLEYEHWRNVWFDPHSRNLELKDCRYIHRRKVVDLDYAIAMWPQHTEALREAATIDGASWLDLDDIGAEEDLPQVALHVDQYGRTRINHSQAGIASHGMRQRLELIETQYRKPVAAKRVLAPGHPAAHGAWWDPMNADLVELHRMGVISLADTVKQEIRHAIWIPRKVLTDQPSPFKHSRFTLTPMWAFRKDRDGMPYGVMRTVRDPQSDLNKRVSKAQFHLATNQLLAEETALADWDEAVEQAARPDGVIKIKDGRLASVQIRNGVDMAGAQLQLMEVAAAQIHDGAGVNREQLGRETNAASGRAIIAKQTEGATTTAALFDNYRLALKLSGQKVLSLAEQYVTGPQVFRITEDSGAMEWKTINKPVMDPITGEWRFEDDITAHQADFIVDAQDYRETMRQAMAEQLMETIGKLPPEVGLQLLDLAVDLTDLPGKSVIVRRIRQINGQPDPLAKDDEETIQRKAMQEQQQQAQAQQQQRAEAARIAKDEASAAKIKAEAQRLGIENQTRAIDAAGLIAAAVPLASTADAVLQAATPQRQE